MAMRWEARLSNHAGKNYEKLKRNGRKSPSIVDLVDLLIMELQSKGPERSNWPHYGKLWGRNYHCHLKKGHPTYVACWKVIDEKLRQIEVYYVGTHEGAPY